MAIESKKFERHESVECKAKRSYRTPELETHGKVEKLTLSTGTPIDGGGGFGGLGVVKP